MRLTRQKNGTYIVSSAALPGSAMFRSGRKQRQDHLTLISPHDKENSDKGGGTGKWRFRFLKQTDGTYIISSAQCPGSVMCTSTGSRSGGHWRVLVSPSDKNNERPGKWRFRLT